MQTSSKNHFENVELQHRPTLMSRWQQLLHVILLIIGWLAFFMFFYKYVILEPFGFIERYIITCAIVIPAVTGWWIMHNLRYRRENMRHHARTVKEEYNHDWEDFLILAHWATLKKAQKICIDVNTETKQKHYLIEK